MLSPLWSLVSPHLEAEIQPRKMMTSPWLFVLLVAPSGGALLTSALVRHQPVEVRQRLGHPCAAMFEKRELEVGSRWEGLISKITDYGFFVKMGHEQHMGLVHIRTLSEERLPRETIEDWVEESVGPIGSKVQVEVLRLEFKGTKRTSLRLLDVIQRQHMEDLVFAPGPGRQRGGYGSDEEDDD